MRKKLFSACIALLVLITSQMTFITASASSDSPYESDEDTDLDTSGYTWRRGEGYDYYVPSNGDGSGAYSKSVDDDIKSVYSWEYAGSGTFGSYEYSYSESGELMIGKYHGSEKNVAIPETIDGKTVTLIGVEAFSRNNSITEVTIPSGVKEIWPDAFENCDNLKKVIIPDTVEEIGYAAFESCDNIFDIKLGNSVSYIGNSAFADCKNLTRINIPESVKSIGSRAFEGCSELKNISVGNSIEHLGDDAFSDVSWYENYIEDCSDDFVMFGNSVLLKYKGHDESVRIPDNVKVIYRCAFADEESGSSRIRENSELKSIDMPDSVKEIGDYAFYWCSSLKSIRISKSLIRIYEKAFSSCESLSSINIPSSVEFIGEEAFKGCTALTDITLPDSDMKLGHDVFVSTPWLEKYISSSSDDYVSLNNCFVKYKGHDKIVILSDDFTEIWSGSFDGCSEVRSVTLPNEITAVDLGMFEGCTDLKEVIALSGQSVYGSWSPDKHIVIIADHFYWLTNTTSIWYDENPVDKPDFSHPFSHSDSDAEKTSDHADSEKMNDTSDDRPTAAVRETPQKKLSPAKIIIISVSGLAVLLSAAFLLKTLFKRK